MAGKLEPLHLFLENNLPEYQRADVGRICSFFLEERGVKPRDPINQVLGRFKEFKQFIAGDWQGQDIVDPKDYRRKKHPHGTCTCGGFFVIRTNRKDGNQFLGCSNYPRCKTTKILE